MFPWNMDRIHSCKLLAATEASYPSPLQFKEVLSIVHVLCLCVNEFDFHNTIPVLNGADYVQSVLKRVYCKSCMPGFNNDCALWISSHFFMFTFFAKHLGINKP